MTARNNGITVRALDALPELRATEGAQLQLLAACDRPHIGTSFPFILGAATAAESSRSWQALLASRDADLSGCLFGRSASQGVAGLRVATFELGTRLGADPLVSPDGGTAVLRDLLEALVDVRRDDAMFVFPRLSERAFERVAGAAAELGLASQWRWSGFGYGFDATVGLDAFLGQMHAHRRRELERRRRRLVRDHAGQFVREEGLARDENLQRLERFLALEDSGWKGRGGTSILRRPGQQQFYRELVDCAWRAGMLTWYTLVCDGVPIAMSLTLRNGPVRWLPKSAYDERYASHSPGMLLTHHLLVEAVQDPDIHWVDNISGTPWVKPWNPVQVPVRSLTLFGRHATARLLRRLKVLKALARGIADPKTRSQGPFDRPLR
jgi:CelD/BcsL family acetyltransferase involved in cellulose biosynthesis